MFTPADHARREEGRLATAIRELAEVSEPWFGGVRCLGGGAPWATGVFGVVGEVPDGAVDELVAWFAAAGEAAKIDLGPFAHRSLLRQLGAFRLELFEHVYFRPLDVPVAPAACDLEVRRVDKSDAAVLEAWIDEAVGGFQPKDTPMSDGERAAARRMAHHPLVELFVAMDGGRVVGGGALELRGPQANLISTAVAATHRRRGAQSALMASRLAEAQARGAEYAYVSSEPGVASERNALRAGFRLAYTKVQLVGPTPR